VRTATIDGQPVDVIAARPVEGGAAEKLYFDRSTGLLVQKEAVRATWALADDLFEQVAFTYHFAITDASMDECYRSASKWTLRISDM